MEWHLVPGVACALFGVLAGAVVPRIIAALSEPEPDPTEDPDDFPDKVLYRDLAARPRLAIGSAVACCISGGLLGGVLGWGWALPWLLVLLAPGCALAVVDYVTWYLPSVLIWPTAAVVAVLQVIASIALAEPTVLVAAAIGFIGLGGYYGLLWFISPRIMAFGDVRLGALIGLALGPFGLTTVLLSVFAAAVVGVIGQPVLRAVGNSIRRHIPFGPFLVVGAVLAVVGGQILAAVLA